MKTPRGNPAFLLFLILFTVVATLLMAFLPDRDAAEVKTYVVHQMVAAFDGCGVPSGLIATAGQVPWGWLFLAGGFTVLVLQLRGRHS